MTVLATSAIAQQPNYHFFNYLIDIQDYRSLQIETENILKTTTSDSLLFYHAQSIDFQYGIHQASQYYALISNRFEKYDSLSLQVVHRLLETDSVHQARAYLQTISVSNALLPLYHLEQSAVNLLIKNTESELSAADIQAYNQLLDSLYQNLQTQKLRLHPTKSVFWAGLFSAIIPGSGKAYAGKPHQGLTNLLMCASLAAISTENYLKRGTKDPRTISFGGLFALFYTGNIYGSAFAAQTHNEEKKYETAQKIRNNLKLAFDGYFGK